MSDQPYNLALHEHLLALGYEHKRIDADWEDTGTADSGPLLHGHNGYDEYAGPDELVVATADGELDREERDLEFEKIAELIESGDPAFGEWAEWSQKKGEVH